MSGTNPFGPTPLSSVGFIPLQFLFAFQSYETPRIAMDGRGVVAETLPGEYTLYDPGGGAHVCTGAYVSGTLAGAWLENGLTRIFNNSSEYPPGFVDPIPGDGNYYYANKFSLLNAAGTEIFHQLSVPTDLASQSNGFPTKWLSAGILAGLGGTFNGGDELGCSCLKLDDFGGYEHGFYKSFSPVGPTSYNGAIRYVSDLSSVPLPAATYMEDITGDGVAQFKAGLPIYDNYNAAQQANPYAANFAANILGANDCSQTLGMDGINCYNFSYMDPAIGQNLPPRLAQDSWLLAQASVAGEGETNNLFANGQFCLPTRLLNSASYAQSFWQQGLAINESMTGYGISTEYPEMQLPGIGLYGSDGSVAYSYVLPQNFVGLDITQSPDLLWVSPTGNVYAVYHQGNAPNGTYLFFVGGTASYWRTGVVNYRYGYNPGG